jgi:hypothetical protein
MMIKIDARKIEYQLKFEIFVWEWDDHIENEL